MAYQRPMVTVDQNMTVTPTSLERDQPAFIFGENYELHRFEDPAEKAHTKAESGYSGSPLELPFPEAIDEANVDTRYTKLFGDNVEVALTEEFGDATYFDGKFNTGLNSVQCGRIVLGGSESESGDGPDSDRIKVGGLLRVSVNGYKTVTKIIGYVGDSGYDEEGNLPGIYIQDQFEHEGDGGAAAVVQVVDVVNGVEFDRKNLKYEEGQGTDALWQWSQGEITDKDGNYHEMGVKVGKLWANIRYDWDGVDGDYYEVLSADLYITFRELMTGFTDTIHSVSSASEVANVLGAVSPDNPLAMGVYMACLNVASDDGYESSPVYFMAVGKDENGEPDYAEVLNRASLTDRVYILAPTTRDEKVLELVRSHVEAMSVKTVKQWRIAAASAYVPRGVDRLGPKMDPQADSYYAVVVPPASDKSNVYRIKAIQGDNVDQASSDTQFRSNVVVGDTVKLNPTENFWGEWVWDEFTVKRVVNNYLLEATPKSGTVPHDYEGKAVAIEVYHEYTAAETAELVASLSRAMASRRMLNVFPSVFANDGVTMTGEFAACAVAGLVSATEPQQPITNVTVRGIDDIPIVYSRYSKADLDLMASGGTFIVCQDLPGDIVYVRHQITTAYPDGNLNTAELSITKNVDDISYKFADLFRPYYGKFNITPSLLVKLECEAAALISRLGSDVGKYGPQLIGDNTEIKYVRQNSVFKDHVDIAISLAVPYPCNNIDIVLTV